MDRNQEIRLIDEKIKSLNKESRDLKKRLNHQANYEERKRRANRLIQTGALVEKYFELDNLNIEEREELFATFSNFIKANKPSKLKK
ncbi:hypothetical protein [Gottfriedia solisilvae]|uniref:hypothetical protein n=1 Tax=Gottfriedia solisilvae TaxID=1516104 RepID=UPI003D2EF6EA